jgi:hypothetical protein
LLKYDVSSREFQTYIDTDAELPTRTDIERTVFTDFLAASASYRDVAVPLVQGLLDLKTKALDQQSETDLYDFVETLLTQTKILEPLLSHTDQP